MEKSIFINLPVADLERSKAFYLGLGFSLNPQFSNDVAACIVISESIFVMLLTRPFFQKFTKKEIADTTKTTEVLNCLSAESREELDELMKRAWDSGGSICRPAKDEGMMYGGAFEDTDGHTWELVWMQAPEAV